MKGYAQPDTSPTKRELVVAKAVIEADSIDQAAQRLEISTNTVRHHLANLRLRLRARNNPELFFKLRDHLAA